MCYAAVSGLDSASSGGFVERMLNVVIVALSLLALAGCGPKCQMGQGAKIEIWADHGATQTVNIGNKTVTVTPNLSVPASALGLQ